MGGEEYDPEQSRVRSLSDWFLENKKQINFVFVKKFKTTSFGLLTKG